MESKTRYFSQGKKWLLNTLRKIFGRQLMRLVQQAFFLSRVGTRGVQCGVRRNFENCLGLEVLFPSNIPNKISKLSSQWCSGLFFSMCTLILSHNCFVKFVPHIVRHSSCVSPHPHMLFNFIPCALLNVHYVVSMVPMCPSECVS
jgi:hypothetical protein